jgi:hypothetical protein
MKLISSKPVEWIFITVNSFLTIFFVAESYLSLQWRMLHDSPILFYMGWLIRKFGDIPYRDFFDMNMPGAHWINSLLGTLFGFSDTGFRRADLTVLATTLILIFIWLRSFGKLQAWFASVVFGLEYLKYGPGVSLQREFLILPFLLTGLLLFPIQAASLKKTWGYLGSGILLGMAVIIKPQAGLQFIVLLTFILVSKLRIKEKLISATIFIAGCGLPFLFAVLYIAQHNGLSSFIEVAALYWPLYTEINGQLQINTGSNRFIDILNGMKSIGIASFWLIPAAFGFLSFIKDKTQNQNNRLKIAIMAGGIFASLLGVIAANKYWDYHWLPLIFFLILVSSTVIRTIKTSSQLTIRWASTLSLILVLAILLRPSNEFMLQISKHPLPPPQGGRVDEIANYLKINLEPGDTVQPLDWSNGAIHAMLIAQAKPATRFLYDFHFYHHISNPEIRNIREEFLGQLIQSKPRIIIQFNQDRPWVTGPDTSRDFPELDEFLNTNYVIDKEKDGYCLWQRK